MTLHERKLRVQKWPVSRIDELLPQLKKLTLKGMSKVLPEVKITWQVLNFNLELPDFKRPAAPQ